jgi:hypothetical protein
VFFSLTKVIESGNIIGIGAFGYVYLFADVLPDFDDDDDDDDDDWRTGSTGFAKASEKAKMAEAPRIMATFESAYLAALVENGDNADIRENDLYFKPVTDSKWFKYEYVTSAQGSIVGYKATASKNIGKFNKGNFLQTVYQKDSDDFTHCVGGKRADMRVVEELIPEFDATVECNNVEIKKASGSAPAPAQQNNTEIAPAVSRDRRLVNKKGEVWKRDYCGSSGFCTGVGIIFDVNGNFANIEIEAYYGDQQDDFDWSIKETGTWYTVDNKTITFSGNGHTITLPYTIKNESYDDEYIIFRDIDENHYLGEMEIKGYYNKGKL